mmetsp:Transcript_8982/g.8532  ORF Transcript_8982/g.8532 Transcript_8982/m.8532 type:complete len:166 (+) Transcript_8982:1257-1754(+)
MSLCKYFFGVIILVFLGPTYINIIIIYSMANLHDVSWGNRATDDNKGEATKRALEQFRSLYLIVWIGLNVVYGYSIIYITDAGQTAFIFVLTFITAGSILVKLVAAVIYFFYEKYTRLAVLVHTRKEKKATKKNRASMKQPNEYNKKESGKNINEPLKSSNTGGS